MCLACLLQLLLGLLGQAQFEMPYVVRLHNFHQLSAPQPCFTFSHPNRGGFPHDSPLTGWVRAYLSGFFSCYPGSALSRLPILFFALALPSCLELLAPCHPHNSSLTDPMIDNNRYCTLEFPVEVNTVLHGFAGYFETVLYQDITLSECLGQWMAGHEYVTWAVLLMFHLDAQGAQESMNGDL